MLFPPFSLPRLPDLVLFPKAFGTPRSSEERARVHHLGPSIDLERREPAFPWERLEEGRPLVYVSLGTMASYTSRLMPRLLRVAAEAAARRPSPCGTRPSSNCCARRRRWSPTPASTA